MRLYEHETKRIFDKYGIPIPPQYGVISTFEEFSALPKVSYPLMVKSAVLIGGRGKAGGIKMAKNGEEAKAAISDVIGLDIKGHVVEKVLIEEAAKEFSSNAQCYVGITIDPSTYMPVFIVSASGGVEIETVARDKPEAVLKIGIPDNASELTEDVAKKLTEFLGTGLKLTEQFKDAAVVKKITDGIQDIISKLYSLFQKVDARLLEINPLLITSEGPLAVDAKLVQDDNAYFRQSEFLSIAGVSAKRHEVSEASSNERRAETAGFPYVDLHMRGKDFVEKKDPQKLYVGLVPGGAGYGIFSIDEVANVGDRFFGGRVVPLNFMDSGGGPPQKRVAEMFHLLMDDEAVDIIISSRFGGISSCDVFIRGLILALLDRYKEKKRVLPIYGRMVGVDLPSAREYLAKAKKEYPEQLKELHMVVGNQKIMADIIRDGLRAGFKYKGIEIEESQEQCIEKVDLTDLPTPTPLERVQPDGGMLYHVISRIRPDIAKFVKETGRVESIVVGLGRQGTKHSGLMKGYGTLVVGGVASGRGGEYVNETIPVYNTVKEALSVNPNIASASVWRHYTTARAATLECIEAGIPIVVLITEFIPLRDVRDILVAARKRKTLLIGGNSPGIIFPPERVKVGMLPDVFHPAEKEPGQSSSTGVTVISRSGAILYHVSDALASIGVSQNAVIGIGGDGANGTTFKDFVPVAMEFGGTDVVVMAGEIGGMQEELLAAEIKKMRAENKPVKPIVALISGKHAPEGKTMGHAGAIVSPGQAYGTHVAKVKALRDAGVVVVNSQFDIIKEVKQILSGKMYFDRRMYYSRMKNRWEMAAPKPSWGTLITDARPNNILISGYPLQHLLEKKVGLLEAIWLLTRLEMPNSEAKEKMHKVFVDGVNLPPPSVPFNDELEDVSKIIAKFLMTDEHVTTFQMEGTFGSSFKTSFTMGRAIKYIATILGNGSLLEGISVDMLISEVISKAIEGDKSCRSAKRAELLESMVVACLDHGVTPPSAQATLITATARAAYEVSVAAGVSAITDVHGGAGAQAALFFHKVVTGVNIEQGIDLSASCRAMIKEYVSANRRIEGLGHRVHTKDPRRDVLLKLVDEAGVAGDRVEVSKIISDVFSDVRGMNLPINVDGVIGAIVADMELPARIAKIIFIYGRIAGLSAHYYEEIAAQPKMRRINFSEAKYRGTPERFLQ